MTKAINDGGPAFPATHIACVNGAVAGDAVVGGMSLRDWFAGQALAGLLASGAHQEMTNHCESSGSTTEESLSTANAAVARFAGSIADAMLAARTQEPTP